MLSQLKREREVETHSDKEIWIRQVKLRKTKAEKRLLKLERKREFTAFTLKQEEALIEMFYSLDIAATLKKKYSQENEISPFKKEISLIKSIETEKVNRWLSRIVISFESMKLFVTDSLLQMKVTLGGNEFLIKSDRKRATIYSCDNEKAEAIKRVNKCVPFFHHLLSLRLSGRTLCDWIKYQSTGNIKFLNKISMSK